MCMYNHHLLDAKIIGMHLLDDLKQMILVIIPPCIQVVRNTCTVIECLYCAPRDPCWMSLTATGPKAEPLKERRWLANDKILRSGWKNYVMIWNSVKVCNVSKVAVAPHTLDMPKLLVAYSSNSTKNANARHDTQIYVCTLLINRTRNCVIIFEPAKINHQASTNTADTTVGNAQ